MHYFQFVCWIQSIWVYLFAAATFHKCPTVNQFKTTRNIRQPDPVWSAVIDIRIIGVYPKDEQSCHECCNFCEVYIRRLGAIHEYLHLQKFK